MKFLTLNVFFVNLDVSIETTLIRGIDSFLNFEIRITVALLPKDYLPSVGDPWLGRE